VLTSFFHFVAEHWVLVLKLASLAITGILGVVGLLNDFKDKNGKLTKWGKISLWGLLFAAFVSLATEIRGYIEQAEQAQQQAKRAQQREKEMADLLKKATDTQERATDTQEKVKKVLETDQAVQSTASKTLERQSQLFDSSQNTLREVERGLTPLGAYIAVSFEIAVPIRDQRFDELRHRIDDEITKLEARDLKVTDWNRLDKHSAIYSTQGLTLHVNLRRDRAHWVDQVDLEPNSALIYQIGKWPQFTLTRPPLGRINIWRKKTALSDCRTLTDPDVVFVVDSDVKSKPEPGAGFNLRVGAPELAITYLPETQEMTLHGSVRMSRLQDNGTIISPLDLTGALLKIEFMFPNVNVPGNGFMVRRLTLYAGHFTFPLDASQAVRPCHDLYIQLSSE
jgi:hypothetical protein